ncbi:hypothetical protein [Eubacterium sp.]|uniref:hypothetical protein n=1 Tax=Eubacterium sp. TaxID=142586 RepID=UPI002FCA7888
MKKDDFLKLADLAEPIIEFFGEKLNPHESVVIDEDGVYIMDVQHFKPKENECLTVTIDEVD